LSSSNLVAKRIAAIVLSCLTPAGFAQDAPAKPLRPPTLHDLYSELNIVDTAISTSGRYVAAIARLEKHDVLVTFDLTNGERKVVQRVGFEEAGKGLLLRMMSVDWKTDERMLLRLRVRPEDPLNFYTVSGAKIAKMGDRLFSIDRTGKAVPLLGDNRNAALEGAFDLGDIRSILPTDPQHILMELDGFNGRSLFKVNIETGRGEQLERPSESVMGWWLDVNGNPIVRVSSSKGTVRLFRKDEENKWRVFHKMKVREMDEREQYVALAPSDDPNRYYVLANPPGHDRAGIYLYDLRKEEFGEPVLEHPTYDLDTARISQDGTKVLFYCYTAHVQICEFTDPKINAHMRGLRKYFEESANVYAHDTAEDGKSIVLFVEGPKNPPGFYYYRTETKDIQMLGSVRKALDDVSRPVASVVKWKTRDGKELQGYLSLPANAPKAGEAKLPLVVHPHGGPESRDHLSFDRWVQYFVARGYAVFQPNFRGSAGFGRAFAESGYGEWGRKMQDDITDGVKSLVDQGSVDGSRMCIVGASYGGYAALAGAALTPDLYQCAVSIAGVSDLEDFIGWRKRNWGSDSEGYKYWLTAIGNPDTDAQKLRDASPVQQASKIKIPVLLIHGTEDFVVPIGQSRAMKKALERSGRKTELIELEKEGHSYWSHNDMYALSAIDEFLWKNLGPGHGISKPPVARAVVK
jgi:dipeptidyl aminopeptidase/acylaminoacyl peptidase